MGIGGVNRNVHVNVNISVHVNVDRNAHDVDKNWHNADCPRCGHTYSMEG